MMLRQSKGLEQLINQLDGRSQHQYQYQKYSQNSKNKINSKNNLNQKNNRSNVNNPFGNQQQSIDFDKFDQVQRSKSSYSKSFLSQMFNKPKIQQQIQNNPNKLSNAFNYDDNHQNNIRQNDNNSSRNIQEISYIYGQNHNQQQSFRFDRSLSYQLNPSTHNNNNINNQRFQRLKQMLSRSKKNNLDAFYKNIQQTKNQPVVGNLQFQNKKEFIQYAKQIKENKRQLENQFQKKQFKTAGTNGMAGNKLKNNKLDLFGKVDEPFKKKNQNILPLEFLEEDNDQPQIDFFYTNNTNNINGNMNNNNNERLKEKQNKFMEQGEDFFKQQSPWGNNNNKAYNNSIKHPTNPLSLSKNKPPTSSFHPPTLSPIREQFPNPLDHSIQQRKFQQLILNYNNMKNNYHQLISQLKQTSSDQYKLMNQLQKIKKNYTNNTIDMLKKEKEEKEKVQMERIKKLEEEKRMKQKEKEEVKRVKESQLKQIKNQIYQIKNSKNNNDVTYMKINQKIQELEKIVRLAIEEVKEQKGEKFTPKVINYFSRQQTTQRQRQKQNNDNLQDMVNLSCQSVRMNQISNTNRQQTNNISQNNNTQINNNNPTNNRINKPISQQQQQRNNYQNNQNINSHYTNSHSVRRYYDNNISHYNNNNNQHNNISRQQLNFIDQFSSPLQLDLSVQQKDNISSGYENDSYYENDIKFCAAENSLQFIPLKLDQSDSKNLRNILTQKSSIIYQSFQFLITIRYTIQSQNQLYPIIGKIRILNKCAIDLLDVFAILYSNKGDNIQISPSKIYSPSLKYNNCIQFQIFIDKQCIQENGFNIQVCYKTDSVIKKKINFKVLLPIIQLIKPEFCYEENFIDCWKLCNNQIYIKPRKLNFKYIRNHQDFKLVLPFIHITQIDGNTFSYGLMFKYPKSKTMFLLKISCYINGKGSIHLRSDKNGDQKFKQQLLNVINFLFLN